MARYQNITGAKLVVTDELGLFVSFEAGEAKEASNYLERYTSFYQTGENVLLKRIGTLEGEVPVAGIEEENIAVRPSAPNSSTVITGPTVDTENTATRLRRIVFNTELDEQKRQIDTRYTGIKQALTTSISETSGALDISGGSSLYNLINTPTSTAGMKATTTDATNSIYGSLLTVGQNYKAWGTVALVNAPLSETIGFVISTTGVVTQTSTTAAGLTVTLTWSTANQRISITVVGAGAGDTANITINFAQTLYNGTLIDGIYNASDELRGWYVAEDADMTASSTAKTLMLLTDAGIFTMVDAGATAFTPWT